MAFWREELGLLPPDDSDRLALDANGSEWDVGRAFSLTNMAALAYEPRSAISAFLANRGWELQDYGSAPHTPLFKVWSDTGWFSARRGEALILALRGTEPPNLLNWATNVSIAPVRASDFIPGFPGRIHWGFAEAFKSVWPRIGERIETFAANGGKRVWITGHSLGGALALLVAARLGAVRSEANRSLLAGLYTCGQPRVGDAEFARSADASLQGRYYRIVHGSDIVPHVPPEFLAPSLVKRAGDFFGGLFGRKPRADYAHAGELRYLPADSGDVANAVPAGYPASIDAVAARLAPVTLLLPGLVIAGRENLSRLPSDILHHFPRGTSPTQTAYVSRLGALRH